MPLGMAVRSKLCYLEVMYVHKSGLNLIYLQPSWNCQRCLYHYLCHCPS